MKQKNWLVIILGVLAGAVVLFGMANRSISADSFYVVGAGNRNIKTGATNTAVGVNALKSNTSGTLNTACGVNALQDNTSGYNNTACGAGALSNNTAGTKNTAVGQGALQTQSFSNNNTAYDTDNTAVGFGALFYNQPTAGPSNPDGFQNTALGAGSLHNNTTGYYNTAAGFNSLGSNTTGIDNTAVGMIALQTISGSNNTAIGEAALYDGAGDDNVALGSFAGASTDLGNFTGSNDIYIGRDAFAGSDTEKNTIRIGNNYGSAQTQTFIMGIANGNPIASGNAVYVTANGRLGVASSSRRYKEDIQDMGKASAGLMQLRPVTFYYKPQYAHGDHTLQYGLIAEEVAKVYPNLVQYDKNGKPRTVYYHLINAMLLNEFQKQHRQLQAETKELKTLRPQLQAQTQELKTLQATVAAVQQQQRLSAAQNRKLLARLAQLESQVQQAATAGQPAALRPVVEAAAVSAIP